MTRVFDSTKNRVTSPKTTTIFDSFDPTREKNSSTFWEKFAITNIFYLIHLEKSSANVSSFFREIFMEILSEFLDISRNQNLIFSAFLSTKIVWDIRKLTGSFFLEVLAD